MELKTTYVLAEPPRSVPLTLLPRLYFGGVAQFGWFFAGFGMIFVWVFVPNADVRSLFISGPTEKATGRVTSVEKTSFSEGGDEHTDGTPVWAVHFAFAVDGIEHVGVSYTLATSFDPGGTTPIEYPAGRPALARVHGLRRKPFAAWAVFPVIFPLVGFGLAFWRLRWAWRAHHLLAHGHLAQATLQSKKATNTEVNNRRVYALTFTFQTVDGLEQTVVAKTSQPKALEDDEEERVLYDAGRPAYAVLMDALPGSAKVDERGNLIGRGVRGLLTLIIPLATLIGHGTWAALVM